MALTVDAYLEQLTKLKEVDPSSPDCAQWLFYGGTESPWERQLKTRAEWFKHKMQQLFQHNIQERIKPKQLIHFERLMQILAQQTSREVHYTQLAEEMDFSIPTIKKWIQLLEERDVIYLLKPYLKNFGKRIHKSWKCFFKDTGWVCYLNNIRDKDKLLEKPIAGALFETACVNRLMHRLSTLDQDVSFFYWESTDGLEVDLLLKTSSYLYPLQMQLASNLSLELTGSLKKWLSLAGKKASGGFLISNAPVVGYVGPKIFNCHFSLL